MANVVMELGSEGGGGGRQDGGGEGVEIDRQRD